MFKDLSGQKFGLWTVIEPVGIDSHRNMCWKCQCDCGIIKTVSGCSLRKGSSKSCGHHPRNVKHGNANRNQTTRLYSIWRAMKHRCVSNKRYYSRGISVCDEWQQFLPFEKWALNNGYDESLTIDRIDNNGNYQPDNCQWVSRYEQARNRSTNIFITYDGRTQVALDWANELGLSYDTICRRYKKGWPDEECLFGRRC